MLIAHTTNEKREENIKTSSEPLCLSKRKLNNVVTFHAVEATQLTYSLEGLIHSILAMYKIISTLKET